MNRSSARPRLAFAGVVVVGIAALVAVAWTTREESVRLDETAGWAERTRTTVAAVQAVSLAAVEAEAAQRSVLMGSTSALTRYQEAVASARRNLDIVAPGLGDDPEQAQLLAGLRMAVEAHLERLDKAVALTPAQPEQARALAFDDRSTQTRRDIQSFADSITATEGQRFDERVIASRELRQAVEADAAVMLLLLVATMSGSALYMLRELKRRAAMTTELEESRLRLELGERRLRAIADNMPACIAYVDRTETYRFTNAAFKPLFGVPPEVFIGRTLREMMGEARRDELAPYIAEALAGHAVHFERRGMGRQSDAVFMVTYVPDFNADGGVDGYYVMALDISARKQAELALANSERRLRTISDHLPATVVRMDTRLDCTYANEQIRRLYGVDPALLVGTSHRAFRGEEEWAVIGPHVEAVLRGELRRFEVAALIDGRARWVQQTLIPEVDAEGRIAGYLSVTFDITERKQQEEELRKSELFLDRTGRMAGVGGWEVDLVTGAVVWSRETRRIHGVDADYVPDLQTAFRFYPPEARSIIEEAVRNAMREGTPWDIELPFVRADGRRIWVRAVGSAEFASGVPVRLVGAFQDISDKVAQRLEIKRVNERMALATESGGIGIWELDIGTGELIWDARMYQLFGDTSGGRAAPQALWDARVHPADLPGLREAMREAMQADRLLDRDYRIVLEDGRMRHLRSTARAKRDADGRPACLIGAAWDITELRELAASLAEDRSLLHVTLQAIGDAVITTNAQGQVTWLNPAAERLTGWSSPEARGRALAHVFHIVDQTTREPLPDPVRACLEQDRSASPSANMLLLSRRGDEVGIEETIAPIRREDGTVLGTVLVFHDVSEQRRLSGEMSWRATHDALTGLVNRAEFEARVARLLKTAQDSGGEHALLYIDLDQFKLVNDACGHAVGDQLLQQVARMLTDSVRTRDTVARLGGDEFALLMERCSVHQAQRVAQQLCDRMDDFRFVHAERGFRIGMSIGLVPLDRRWQTASGLQQAADTACYAAKEAGRNRVHTWFDTHAASRERQLEMPWVARLEQALDDDRFVLYAQRLTPLEETRAPAAGVHAEVLLRMCLGDGALALPGAFLPAAERFHLASRIDRWVLRHVVDWMKALQAPERIGMLSVNLSCQSLLDRGFHQWALELLAEAGPPICDSLGLEFAETAAVANLADTAVFIDQLHALGVKVALDDFGAGAASFGYLKTLRVDTLKIDGQFARDLVDDALDEAAMRCFADVARVMSLRTVAKSVDKPAVLERLQAMGVDFAQGFLLQQPAPIGALIEPAPAVA
jgi:diguanylate cyclase